MKRFILVFFEDSKIFFKNYIDNVSESEYHSNDTILIDFISTRWFVPFIKKGADFMTLQKVNFMHVIGTYYPLQ